jgi:hypothetical protein
MIIKSADTTKSSLSLFDLLGNNETALAKAFGYLISIDKDCYFEFLDFLGVKQSNNDNNFFSADIKTEKDRDEGRTDIELISKNDFHIIVECKVNSGKVIKQRTQYLASFDLTAKQKILCFLTQERDTNKQFQKDIQIRNTSWLEIIELYNKNKFTHKPIVSSFLKFATKNYSMRELKEILIQDLKEKKEIERFQNFGVYRRDQTFGTPIYFAPYFTRGATQQEGISNLSKIVGILTLTPNDIDTFRSDLEAFSQNKEQVDNWINGVKHGNDSKEETFTYYFLDSPLVFKSPLRKSQGNEKGTGKGWISKFVPKNRCVSFIDFIKHIPELQQ